MRILIDLQGAQGDSRFRGIGRYSLSLALAMARNAKGHEIWLALSAAFPQSILELRQSFSDLIPQERIRVFSIPQPTAEVDPANAWRARAAEIIREEFIESINPDVIHVHSLFEGYGDDAVVSVGVFKNNSWKTAVTLYDLIPLLDQDSYLPNFVIRNYYFRKIESIKRAGLLLAISESSRAEAINELDFAEDKVFNISAGTQGNFQVLDLDETRKIELRERYGISRKIILYAPGGFDSRKNFHGLMLAFAMLPKSLRTEYQLTIASRLSKGADDSRAILNQWRIQAGLTDDELVLTDYVPDEDLIGLYNLADLFVFPSKHEGFGLPPLEAMSCGTPTLASNASSLPEVVGWDQAMFDPNSPEDMAAKIERALVDGKFRLQLKQHALIQAKKFNWNNSAQLAISALEHFHARNQLIYSAGSKSGNLERPMAKSLIASIAELERVKEAPDSDLAKAADSIAFNSSYKVQRQLLVDITELVQHDAKSGIQRVVRSLLLELIQQVPLSNKEFQLRPIYFDGQQYRYANCFLAKFLVQSVRVQKTCFDDIAEINQDDVYFGLDLLPSLVCQKQALFQKWRAFGVQVYFVVYDILLANRPDWAPKEAAIMFRCWLSAVTQVATGLVCISDSVAKEVKEWLTVNPGNRSKFPTIEYFHLGADVSSSAPTKGMPENTAETLAALRLRTSFLSVGTIEPRKGHWQMLKAFEDLWAKNIDVNLVLIGKQGWMMLPFAQQLRKHPELNKRLIWLDAISDEYLEKIYAASSCLIAASEGEGFGLPLIEAASHHLPIIARELPVFREVAGEHAYYFSGLSGEDLSKAVIAWLELLAHDATPKSDHMPHLTWAQSCEQILPLIIRSDKEKF